MQTVPSDPQALLAHADFVRALARTLVRDAARADDLEQETWLAALEHPPRSPQAPRGWLLTVLRNFARRFARGEARRARWEGEAGRAEPVPSSLEIVAREEARRRVVEAVLALEEPYRSAVVLRFYEDLPPRAIARRLGVPNETARTRVKRGLAHLRTRLDREWGGDRSAWCAALSPLALKRAGIAPAVLGGVAVKATTQAAIAAALVLGLAITLWPEDPDLAPESARDSRASAAPTSPAAGRPSLAAVGSPRQEAAEAPGAGAGKRQAVEKEGPRVTGLVVDRGGRPIPGARVSSYPANVERTVRLSPDPESDPVQTTVTDETGRFEVPLGGRSPTYNLAVEAQPFSPRFAAPIRPGDDVKIVLDPARAFFGTVADLEGHPVAGARVRWLGYLVSAQIEHQAVSGADGSYRIEGIASPRAAEGTGHGLDWWLDVQAGGFAPLRIWGSISPEPDGDARHDLFLIRGATLRGRVVDGETGSAIPGAAVYLWSWDGHSGGGLRIPSPLDPVRIGETASGADGAFMLEHVPAAGFHRRSSDIMGPRGLILGYVGARAAGYATGFEDVLYVKDGQVTDSTVRLWRSAKVRGRVLDRSGKPVAGVPVQASCPERVRRWTGATLEGVSLPTTETDSEGRYSISDVPAGLAPAPVMILARVRGSNASAKVEVRLRAGEELEAPDIALKTDPCADLLVVDEQGRPVWGANAYGRGLDRGCVTDESGRARLFCPIYEGESPRSVVLVVRAAGHAPGRTPEFVPSEENPPGIRVVLAPGHRVGGSIVLPDERPATGVDMYVVHPAIRPEEIESAMLDWGDWKEGPGLPGPRVLGFATSREDGSFEVRNLPEGPYTLVTMWKGGPTARVGSELRALLTGIGTDASDVVFRVPSDPEEEAAREMITLEGTVTDSSNGAPLLDFEATLTDGKRVVKGMKTSPGRFRVEAPPGTWTLKVTSEGFAPWERAGIEVARGRVLEPIAVALDGGTTVRGVVRGLPSTGDFSIEFRREGERRWPSSPLETGGTYRATGFRPGKYRVRLFADRFLPSNDPVDLTVPEGEKEVVCDIEAVPAGTLGVRLRSARGSVGETVVKMEIRDKGGRVVRTLKGTTSGLLHFPLLPGEYRLRVEFPGGEIREAMATVEEGKTFEVEFEIP